MTKPKAPPTRRDATFRRAFYHFDKFLEEKAPTDYSEMIDLFGRSHFGDLWDRRPNHPNPE
jgi:hypothetical protein